MKNAIYDIFIKIINALFPVVKRKVLFIGYYGGQYGCNPKYLSEYFVAQGNGWDIVWAFTEPKKYNIPGIRKVKYLSFRYLYELCTAGVVITNYRMTGMFRKREGQIYVQTWHSSLRLKMIEGDSEASLPSHYVTMAKEDSRNIDVLLSGCRFSTEIFERAFWYGGKILGSGTPRCDVLFGNNEERIKAVKKRLAIGLESKVVLYAPTFRKNDNLSCYNIDYSRLVDTLETSTGADWQVLVRLHPHLKNHSGELLMGSAGVMDVTAYDDIQELLMISDYLISDYSGLIFDYLITGRPCLLYVPDLDEYTKNDRDLYFNIDELPFPTCKNNDDLSRAITNFSEDEYNEKISLFLSLIGNYEDGNACERVYKYIEKLLSK